MNRCFIWPACILVWLVLEICNTATGATITWTNTAGGNWNATNNWNPNQIPGGADSAFITTPGNYTVSVGVNSSVSNLVIGATSGIQNLTVTSGVLTATNGTVGTNGVLTLNATFAGSLTVRGTFTSAGGSISSGSAVTVQSNAVMNISGNNTTSLSGVLTNQGTVTWSGTGNLQLLLSGSANGSIINQPGALFNVLNDQTIGSSGGSPYFLNAGTFQKSGSNTIVNVLFTNTGTMNVASGTVTLSSGGLDTGTVAGAGSISVTANTFSLNGTVPNLVVGGSGTVNGLGAVITNLTWSSGTVQGTNTIKGIWSWTGGTIGSGGLLTVASSAVLNITGGNTESLNGLLVNAGTVNWTGPGNLQIFNSGNAAGGIVNQPGALFNAPNDQFINNNGGFPYFSNAGTFQKSGSNTIVNVIFTNTGTMNLVSGAVTLTAGGLLAGTVAGAGSVGVTGNTVILNSTVPNLVVGGGTVNGLGAVITNLTWSNGTVQGTNTIKGIWSWTGGTIGSGGLLMVANNAVLTISGGNTETLNGLLVNAGTVNWTGPGNLQIFNNGGSGNGGIVNQPGALFNAPNDQFINNNGGSPYFSNAGTFQKSGSNTIVNVIFTNTGTMNLVSGAVTLTAGGLLAGTVTGAGSVGVTGNTVILNSTVPNLVVGGGGTVNGLGAVITNLTWSNGTVQGTNTIKGIFSWTGGTLGTSGLLTVAAGAVLTISGGSTETLNGLLVNAGTINWIGPGNLQILNSGANNGGIFNQPGALFNAQNDQSINNNGGSPYFSNAGTFQKSGSNTFVNVIFTNTGTMNVASGTVTLTAGGVNTGVIVGPGNLNVTAGTFIMNGAVLNLLVTGGTVTGVSGVITNLTLGSGTVQGTNIIKGTWSWTGGAIGPGGWLTVESNAVLNISGGNSKNLNGVLASAGTINWGGTGNLQLATGGGNNGAIINQSGALFNAQGDQTMANNGGSPYFVNAGTFQKSAGTNSFVNVTFTNTGAMSLNVYSQTSASRIVFASSVALGGTLNVTFQNPYSPSAGDSFPLLTYGSETGTFSTLNGSPMPWWQTNLATYGTTLFTLTVGSFYKLVFTTPPVATTNAGAVFAPVVVQAELLNGTPFATNGAPVTMTLSSGSGVLSGTVTQNTDATGRATFNNLSINLAGPKVLQASSPPWITPTNSSVTIVSSVPARLALITSTPSPQRQGYPFSPLPTVQVRDQFGNLVSNSAVLITASSSSTGSGGVGGTTGVNANGTNGSAVFNNLYYVLGSPNRAESVTVYFTSPGLVPATNNPVTVDFASGLITLANGNSAVQIDPNSQSGMFSWIVDGMAELYQHWFWLRQTPGGPQKSFDQLGTPLGSLVTSSNAIITYLPAGLNATLQFTLQGGSTGSHSSSIVEAVSIQNTNTSPITVHVYDYADFDAGGVEDDDLVTFPASNQVVQQGKGVKLTQSVDPAPNFWEASWYAFTLDTINSATPAVLPNSNVPNQPGDQTFAFQWDLTIPAGQTVVLNLTNSVQNVVQASPPGELAIKLSGLNAIVYWPTNGAGSFVLQASGGLEAGSTWTNLPGAITAGTNYQVTVPLAGKAHFYRLH